MAPRHSPGGSTDQAGPRCPKRLAGNVFEPPSVLDWRVRERDIRPSPSFFLHRLLGAGEDAVRADFTALLAGRSFEAVLPNVWSQYLSDMRLLDALAQHSERRRAASEAEWQVVDCAAYTSRVLGSVTNRTEAHHERMQALLGALLANPLWSDRRAKWLFIQPHYDLRGTVGRKLAEALVQRNAQIGPAPRRLCRAGTWHGVVSLTFRGAVLFRSFSRPSTATGRTSEARCPTSTSTAAR